METEEIKKTLKNVLRQLGILLESIESESTQAPPRTIERLKKKLCVLCGNPLDGEPKRGCHANCHRKIDRAIKAGATTDSQAILDGQWAPKERGGRKPSPLPTLDEHIKELFGKTSTTSKKNKLPSKKKGQHETDT